MIPFDSNGDGKGFRRGREGAGGQEGSPGRGPQGARGDWGGRLREFPDPGAARVEAEPRAAAPGQAERRAARGAWLVPPLMLAAVAAGVLFVLRGPDQIFGVVFGLVLGLGVLWILISTLFPAKADRTCPQCGTKSLERIDSDSTTGVHCAKCKWRDESASSFLFAEEEGPFEDIVLRERRRRW